MEVIEFVPLSCVHAVTQSCLILCDPVNCSPRILCPWNSLDKNTGMGCHALLQGLFPTQAWNTGLLHCRQILYHGATGEAPSVSPPLPFLESPLLLILTLYGKCGRAGGQWSSGPKGHTLHCQNYLAVLLRFLNH